MVYNKRLEGPIIEYQRIEPRDETVVMRDEMEEDDSGRYGQFRHFTNIGYESDYLDWFHKEELEKFEKQKNYDLSIKSAHPEPVKTEIKSVLGTIVDDSLKLPSSLNLNYTLKNYNIYLNFFKGYYGMGDIDILYKLITGKEKKLGKTKYKRVFFKDMAVGLKSIRYDRKQMKSL